MSIRIFEKPRIRLGASIACSILAHGLFFAVLGAAHYNKDPILADLEARLRQYAQIHRDGELTETTYMDFLETYIAASVRRKTRIRDYATLERISYPTLFWSKMTMDAQGNMEYTDITFPTYVRQNPQLLSLAQEVLMKVPKRFIAPTTVRPDTEQITSLHEMRFIPYPRYR